MQTTLTGEFVVASGGTAAWRIANRLAPGEFVILRGAPAALRLLPRAATRLVIDWAPGGSARVTQWAGAETLSFEAANALLHEPRLELYEPLQLPRFTPDMARFWHRVFRVVKLPGGRWLLGWIAHRARR